MTRVLVIAEAGVNHDGDPDRARRMVEAAAAAGADAVKFQTFRAAEVVTGSGPKADYQRRTTAAAESQRRMLEGLELSPEAHRELVECCREHAIEFLSTPFDLPSLRFLVEELGVGRLKIASGEITNGPLLLAAARTGLPLIVSTGMSTLEEIRTALGVVAFGAVEGDERPSGEAFAAAYESATGRRALHERVTLLQCTTEYPTPFEDACLRAMDAIREAFDLPVGLSDHTEGIVVSLGAVARDAPVIEKHFTLDRSLPGPDHAASLEPEELERMIRGVRTLEVALGERHKAPRESELRNARVVRRGLVAARPIAAGEELTADNVAAKRPADGPSPMRYWELLGRKASRSYREDEPLEESP